MKLTDLKIKSAKPLEKSYRLFAGDGLYLEIYPNASKMWRLKYRLDGKEKRMSLGKYPEVTLAEAREKAAEKKKLLSGGEDPVRQSKSEKEIVFLDVATEWLKIKGKNWVPAHHRRIEQRVAKYLLPALGNMEIKEIAPDKVLPILRALEASGKTETAHRVLGTCSLILRYAVACGYILSDPCRDLKGALSAAKSKPFAAITNPAEVGLLLRNMDSYAGGIVVKYALLFAALTFCRPGEIRFAQWSEIDFDKMLWSLPPEKTKMNKAHHVPLATQTLALLEELKFFTGNRKYIFPNARHFDRPISDASMLAALRSMGYDREQMTVHGFRSMASTLLNELGYKHDVIEAQLAHAGYDQIRAIYNRAEYMDERRQLMQDWANYLDALRTCRP